MKPFANRRAAGVILASRLSQYQGRMDVVVLALPRGGVPVGYEVARRLGALLDVFLVRKLGLPGQEELAMGAIATGGVRVLNAGVTVPLGISDEIIERVAERERLELARRERLYRGDRSAVPIDACTAILVDDGLATGSTMRAAAIAARTRNPSRLVVAVPVAARETCEDFRTEVDEVVCAETPEPFTSVGLWYEDFSQTSDDEVRSLLAQARQGWNVEVGR
jgi:putative phosphoribosyl transferase